MGGVYVSASLRGGGEYGSAWHEAGTKLRKQNVFDDFIAAGDLLNWVLAQRNEGRAVQFVDTHRLVALFFGAMGINER